jgi:hypothetical protein
MAWRRDTLELDVFIEYDYVPYVPARTMGPPVEVNAIYLVDPETGGKGTVVTFLPKELEKLEERLYDEHASEGDY